MKKLIILLFLPLPISMWGQSIDSIRKPTKEIWGTRVTEKPKIIEITGKGYIGLIPLEERLYFHKKGDIVTFLNDGVKLNYIYTGSEWVEEKDSIKILTQIIHDNKKENKELWEKLLKSWQRLDNLRTVFKFLKQEDADAILKLYYKLNKETGVED